jgi:hypothetical protein
LRFISRQRVFKSSFFASSLITGGNEPTSRSKSSSGVRPETKVCAAAVVGTAPWFLDRPADGGAGWNAVCAAISVLAALVVLKHRSNLARLARGTENRFCFTERQRAERDRRRAEREAAEKGN